jgi:hypothetical protein
MKARNNELHLHCINIKWLLRYTYTTKSMCDVMKNGWRHVMENQQTLYAIYSMQYYYKSLTMADGKSYVHDLYRISCDYDSWKVICPWLIQEVMCSLLTWSRVSMTYCWLISCEMLSYGPIYYLPSYYRHYEL